eukprot:358574-Chlamydomonas_euryale.AAC.2
MPHTHVHTAHTLCPPASSRTSSRSSSTIFPASLTIASALGNSKPAVKADVTRSGWLAILRIWGRGREVWVAVACIQCALMPCYPACFFALLIGCCDALVIWACSDALLMGLP